MTKAEWLACTDPERMLKFLRETITARQLRLIACAICYRIWHLLPDAESKRALEAAEQYADDLTNEKELAIARDTINYLYRQVPCPAYVALYVTCSPPVDVTRVIREVIFVQTEERQRTASTERMAALRRTREVEFPAISSLIRHIIGNPFRPYPASGVWPEAVIRLADALYHGHDCGFALHDALLEAGHADLADHFRQEQHHPKGCWALDLLLEKG